MPAKPEAPKVAVYSWITMVDRDDIADHFDTLLRGLGLAIDPEVSNRMQLYASDAPGCEIPPARRVTVLASWTSWRQGECQIEVRSPELILVGDSRCRLVADALMERLPPPPGARAA